MNSAQEQADYLKANFDFHTESYSSGYGIEYPEGHVIRIYHRVLKYEFGFSDTEKGRTFLDFGTGNGTHCVFFKRKGFDVYGIDADPKAIQICKERLPDISGHFTTVAPRPDMKDYFDGVQYDVVLCNQALYYLSDSDLKTCVANMHRQMKPGGIFIATMMGTKNSFYDRAVPAEDGMSKVSLSGRENGDFFINFTESPKDLGKKFDVFKPVHVGHYDTVIREDEGSGFHYLFIGKKA